MIRRRCSISFQKYGKLTPTMTSATTPSGIITAGYTYHYKESEPESRYPYYAFDGTLTNQTAAETLTSATNFWICYEFPNTIDLTYCKAWFTGYKKSSYGNYIWYYRIWGSNNNSTWTALCDAVATSVTGTVTESNFTTFTLYSKHNKYKYLKFGVESSNSDCPYAHYSGQYWTRINEIQYYGYASKVY